MTVGSEKKTQGATTDREGPPPPPAKGIFSWLPGLWVLKNYRRAWLIKDVLAGLVLTSLLVPAGMGYAEAAGLPAIAGLYATIIPLLAYAVFGPSRILMLGPDSALAALIAASIVALAAGDTDRAVGLGSMLAIMTGAFCIIAGLFKFGFITDFLSKPVRVGYLNGICLTVLVTQLPKLLGFSVKSTGLIDGVAGLLRGLADGQLQLTAFAIGSGSLVLILLLQRFTPRIPGILIAVCLATIAVTVFHLAGDVAVVGALPPGFPTPALPQVNLADLSSLAVAAAGIALVSCADTSVLSRTYASRTGVRVDPNRELVALGVANLAGGLFRGFPISSSSSRTPVAESAGSRTQVTGVVGAVCIAVLLLAAPGLTKNLPTAALAAVVIAAVLRNFDVAVYRVYFRVRKSDFVVAVVAFLGVVALGVIKGIAIAVIVSILDILRRAWRPHSAILGQAKHVQGYHDLERYPDARQVPGLVLFRWDAPLFFANADTFRQRVLEAIDAAENTVRWVVVAAEPITDVDTTAAEMIQTLDEELATRGAELAFAEMKDPVKDRLHRYGLHRQIGDDFFFPTVDVAVEAFLARTKGAKADTRSAIG